jgi:hypothetical protein
MSKERYLSPLNTYGMLSFQRSINEIDEEDEEEFSELPQPFFYTRGKFYHFNRDDLLKLLLMCDYEEVKLKENDENMFAILKRNGERIYLLTFPDRLYLKFKADDSLAKLEVKCYSSFVFYKNMNGKIRLWKFEKNDLFKKWFLEYINCLFSVPSYIL